MRLGVTQKLIKTKIIHITKYINARDKVQNIIYSKDLDHLNKDAKINIYIT